MSKVALDKAVDCIFEDQGTRDVAKALYKAADWKSGVSTHSLLLTIEDYLKDLKEWLDGPFYKRAVTVRHPLSPSSHALGCVAQKPTRDGLLLCRNSPSWLSRFAYGVFVVTHACPRRTWSQGHCLTTHQPCVRPWP